MSNHKSAGTSLPITLRLVLALLAVSLPPMIGTAYYNLRGSLESVATQERENLRLLAISTANRLDQLMTDTERVVRVLVADEEVAAFLGRDGASREAFRATTERSLHAIKNAVPEFASVYLMDRDGVFVASTNPQVVGKRYDFRSYYREAIAGKFYISDLLFGSTSGSAGIYFSGAVRDREGEVLGVAVIKLEGSAVTGILDAIHAHRRATPFLVNGDGVLIHHPDPALRFHTLENLPPARVEEIQANKRFPVENLKGLGLGTLARALFERRLPGDTRYLSPIDGGARVAGFAPMGTQQWVVVVSEEEARFSEPLNRLFEEAMFSVGGVALATLLFAALLGRALARPIGRLIYAAGIMERGDYKESPEPFTPELLRLGRVTSRGDELGQLARVFETMAGEVYQREEELEAQVRARTHELEEKNHQLEQAQQRIREELRVAKSLQLSILPTTFPVASEFDLHATMTPAREVGGDFYDYFALDEHRVGVVVADVSGKGVPAAFFMAVSRTVVQGVAQRRGSPGAVLEEANDILCHENPLELFVTLFYGVLDLRSGEFVYASGGHNPPVRIARDGTTSLLESTDGIALGVMDGLPFEERRIRLEAGETLFLYTDGVTEAFDPANVPFGEERLFATVRDSNRLSARDLSDRVVAAVHHFAAGADASDDLTCLVLHYRGGEPA